MRPFLIVSAPSTGVLNVRKAKDVPLLIQNEEPVRKMQKESTVPDPFPINKKNPILTRTNNVSFQTPSSVPDPCLLTKETEGSTVDFSLVFHAPYINQNL